MFQAQAEACVGAAGIDESLLQVRIGRPIIEGVKVRTRRTEIASEPVSVSDGAEFASLRLQPLWFTIAMHQVQFPDGLYPFRRRGVACGNVTQCHDTLPPAPQCAGRKGFPQDLNSPRNLPVSHLLACALSRTSCSI